jgi:hypothetical protein
MAKSEEKKGGLEHTTPLLHCQTSELDSSQSIVKRFMKAVQLDPWQVIEMESVSLPLHMAYVPVIVAMAKLLRRIN